MNRTIASFATLGRIALAALLALGSALWADEIHDAAKQGDLEKVRALVDAEPALVAAKDQGGQTALHWAALSENLDLVRRSCLPWLNAVVGRSAC